MRYAVQLYTSGVIHTEIVIAKNPQDASGVAIQRHPFSRIISINRTFA